MKNLNAMVSQGNVTGSATYIDTETNPPQGFVEYVPFGPEFFGFSNKEAQLQYYSKICRFFEGTLRNGTVFETSAGQGDFRDVLYKNFSIKNYHGYDDRVIFSDVMPGGYLPVGVDDENISIVFHNFTLQVGNPYNILENVEEYAAKYGNPVAGLFEYLASDWDLLENSGVLYSVFTLSDLNVLQQIIPIAHSLRLQYTMDYLPEEELIRFIIEH